MVLVAVRQGDSVERLPILVDGSSGEAVVEIQPDVRELYAVVGAWSDTLSWDEAFDYTLSVQKQEGGSDTAVDDDTASDTAPVLTLGRASATAERGCSTVVGAGGALGSVVTWLLLSGLLVNRREIRV